MDKWGYSTYIWLRQNSYLSVGAIKRCVSLQSRSFNGLNSFEHNVDDFITCWRKVGCVKRCLSGHLGDEWVQSYRTTLSFLKELFMYEGSRSTEITQAKGNTTTPS